MSRRVIDIICLFSDQKLWGKNSFFLIRKACLDDEFKKHQPVKVKSVRKTTGGYIQNGREVMLCFIDPKVLFKITPDSVKGEVCKYIAKGSYTRPPRESSVFHAGNSCAICGLVDVADIS